jgi:hypothetical protein
MSPYSVISALRHARAGPRFVRVMAPPSRGRPHPICCLTQPYTGGRVTKPTVSPFAAPSRRNCSPNVVLPVPGPPRTRCISPRGRPPPRISSSPSMPVAAFIAVLEGHLFHTGSPLVACSARSEGPEERPYRDVGMSTNGCERAACSSPLLPIVRAEPSAKQAAQGVQGNGFGDPGSIPQRRLRRVGGVMSRRQRIGDAPRHEHVGCSRRSLAAEIDVEKREVRRVSIDKLLSLRDRRCRADRLATKTLEQLLDFYRDEIFVLNNEDTQRASAAVDSKLLLGDPPSDHPIGKQASTRRPPSRNYSVDSPPSVQPTRARPVMTPATRRHPRHAQRTDRQLARPRARGGPALVHNQG